MVIDTSAIVAILLEEPEAPYLMQAIALDKERFISTFSVLEASFVISSRKGDAGLQQLKQFLEFIKVEQKPLTDTQVNLATEAWLKFGKGRHPASLNIGDCCTYALSKETDEALLFKGNDFSQTDLELVDYSRFLFE
jgi:ribonuclease VapC